MYLPRRSSWAIFLSNSVSRLPRLSFPRVYFENISRFEVSSFDGSVVERLASIRGDPRSIPANSKNIFEVNRAWFLWAILLSSSTSSHNIHSTVTPWFADEMSTSSRQPWKELVVLLTTDTTIKSKLTNILTTILMLWKVGLDSWQDPVSLICIVINAEPFSDFLANILSTQVCHLASRRLSQIWSKGWFA